MARVWRKTGRESVDDDDERGKNAAMLEGDASRPRLESMSLTSLRVTCPSSSRSRIWNPSRISRIWGAGSLLMASALLLLLLLLLLGLG